MCGAACAMVPRLMPGLLAENKGTWPARPCPSQCSPEQMTQVNWFVWGKCLCWRSGKCHPVELWERGLSLVTPLAGEAVKYLSAKWVSLEHTRPNPPLISRWTLWMSLHGLHEIAPGLLLYKIREESWLADSLGVTSCTWRQKYFCFLL